MSAMMRRLTAALEAGAGTPKTWEFALAVDDALEQGRIPGPTELNLAIGRHKSNNLGGPLTKIRSAMFEADGLVRDEAANRWRRP
jgi:hypothetical protein